MLAADPLPSWTDGLAKAQVLEFLVSVTQPGDSFVPEPKRVAVLDTDGTLCCEKPFCSRTAFLLQRWQETTEAHPGKAKKQPWKAVAAGDQAWLADFLATAPEVSKGLAEAYAGISVFAFEKAVRAFFEHARHPLLGVPYTRLGYEPMRELITLLASSGFQVYLCATGGRDFVSAVSKRMYGIPRERVIGSAAAVEYRHGKLVRTRRVEQPLDDGPGKPVQIWARTGRKPILAAGNADGDVAMLEQAQFSLLIRHDDAEREFAYDAGAERALASAKERGWTVVSMHNDFASVFDLSWPERPARRADDRASEPGHSDPPLSA